MSRETAQWLNTQTLIGFTDRRGHAWHYRAEEQGAESNHYPGAVPVEDLHRRLFPWEAVAGTITATALTPDGVLQVKDPDRKAIMRSDTGAVLGVFKQGYEIHQYREWLVDQVANLLDDTLQVGSAGLLRGGAQAWVQIEVPDSITTPEGVEFRPHLLAATSLDGSLATTYGRSITNTVCAALGEMGAQKVKVRHSRYSRLKLASAREALQMVWDTADAFSAQVAQLCDVTVTDAQWAAFLDSLAPLPTEEGRGRTLALNKRDALTGMYDHDNRVSPWRGTAYGVVQAVNTYTHHAGNIQGDRGERNASRAITGGVDKLDTETLATLQAVLA